MLPRRFKSSKTLSFREEFKGQIDDILGANARDVKMFIEIILNMPDTRRISYTSLDLFWLISLK